MKILLLFVSLVFAKDFGLPPVDLRQGQFTEGSLFSVKYVFGQKNLRFFVVGKQSAQLRLGEIKPKLRIGNRNEEITLDKNAKSFVSPTTVTEDAVLILENSKGESEIFRLKKP